MSEQTIQNLKESLTAMIATLEAKLNVQAAQIAKLELEIKDIKKTDS